MVTLLVGLLLALPPGYCQPAANSIAQPGVILTYEDDVDDTNLEAIADVVHVAKQAFDALFPELAQPQIHVHVWDATQAYWEGVITDRVSTIYVGLGPHGIGEDFRPDACPVGILCQAVAELHNPNRLPGFDRFVAQRCLAPAVAKALGTTPLPHTRLQAESEDVTGRLAAITSPECTAVHPDYAAVAAMLDIERQVGLPTLKELLLPALASERDPFGAFRTAAVAGEPALADAFTAYDEATRVPVGEDGTCLIASFEPDEGVTTSSSFMRLATLDELPLIASNLFESSFTDEWATDGKQSLKLQATQTRPTLGLILSDPDWRYKDWTQFRQFRMDLRYEGAAPAEVYAYAADDVGRGHGMLTVTGGMMQSGDVRHVSVDLTDDLIASSSRSYLKRYYDGAFRAHEVAALQITVANPPGPFTLYVDNIRLTPRATPAATGAAARAHVEAPVPAELRAQAAALLEQGIGLKREGKLAEAEEELRVALKLDDRNVEIHRVLGWTLLGLNRKAEAAAAFRKVLELHPGPEVEAEVKEALTKLE